MKMKQNIFVSAAAWVILGSVKGLSNNDHGCSSGWHTLNGDCFYISILDMFWESAKHVCETKGSNLAQPTNATQVQDLVGLLKGLGHNRRKDKFWVGARNQNSVTYRYLNGNSVTAGWLPLHPTSTDSERCVVIVSKTGKNNSGLSVWKCEGIMCRFICQISYTHPKTVSTLSTTATETTPITTETNVIWYVAGGILLLLLLGLLCVFCLKRSHERTSTSESIPNDNCKRVATRHDSENSLYGTVAGSQNNSTGKRGSAHVSENSLYGAVTLPQNDSIGKRGVDHDSVNSLYGVVLTPEDNAHYQ